MTSNHVPDIKMMWIEKKFSWWGEREQTYVFEHNYKQVLTINPQEFRPKRQRNLNNVVQ